jgi:hypothetical protein
MIPIRCFRGGGGENMASKQTCGITLVCLKITTVLHEMSDLL